MAQTSAQRTIERPVKRRAACDICRTKKLKCSGGTNEHSRCTRCQREDIPCIFSAQKQMGRPKKRARQEEGHDTAERSPTKRNAIRQPEPAVETSPSQDEAFDAETYESAFTPGGSLQPWLQNDWPTTEFSGEGGHNGHGIAGGVPGLTPDSSSSTSAILGLHSSRSSSLTNGHVNGSSNDNDSSTAGSNSALLLDPALGGMHSSYMPSCACLSTLYLTLNSLQAMNSDNFNFPFSLHPLREAMQTASTVLKCSECPKRFITGIQNVQLVGTLLMSIAERFDKILGYINSEASRAKIAGETKKFRLADLNTPSAHLHAGGLGCVAAFSVDLSPEEWRSMSKKVVRAEVHGPEDGNSCCPYFVGLCKQMEERQTKWHSNPCPEDFPRNADGVAIGREETHAGSGRGQGEHLCLKLVGFANRLVANLDWS
ncbi:Putative zn(2)-C6 fungal-type DNA-binding domain-containing protein [Septoria linicola]|uniref:Zn(2)-C6 fungal-type DNA-binding domain-containing protein n=1 Tax=Septoria linicola TaxID=215465 RepID=A0A9Q9EF70_9PEZI|nr:putative zn(2)-C6 fungal-type DNA-binding domain-containing protein [Septoria linicola]USW46893.1 Putative zn(2)-C6 fungal-type DNA-binding domain-containing protein [Septoria linicola]